MAGDDPARSSASPTAWDADRRVRTRYIVLALATIAVGLIVHRGHVVPAGLRDGLGDALWAAMVFWWAGAIRPRSGTAARALGALAFAWAVEASQLFHPRWLDVIRATTLGHLVLGSDFDARDLVAYAVGVGVAALLDRRLRSR